MKIKVETLFDNPWLSVKQVVDPDRGVNGYVYSHEHRCGGHIVAVLPYRSTVRGGEFLLRSEVTPCWGMLPELSAITGGCEFTGDKPHPLSLVRDAVRELEEESGFCVPEQDLQSLGSCRGTKSCDTVYHLFSVDVKDRVPDQPSGDGSQLEAQASVEWVTDPWMCVDPIAATMHGRLIALKIFEGVGHV